MVRTVALVVLANAAGVLAVPRQLQDGVPEKCESDEAYQGWLALVNSACCTHAATACDGGLPTTCDDECANVLSPFKRYCKTRLQADGVMPAVTAAYRACPHVSKNTRGCPRDIPSVSDSNAQQSCSGGDGFWPVGSACAVRCADGFVPAPIGGGHRRAQAADGSVEYICTSGGDWLAATPLSCVAVSAGPPPPPAPSQLGRFSVGTTPMTIQDAINYCRTTSASLASIHSPEEQEQVVTVCSSVRTDATTGATVNGDQATHGGYGCWIGFEDSASDGGFVWTDGSNVDYVNFYPGEPNGNRCDTAGHQGNYCSAVSIDMRGYMGDLGMDLDPSVGARGRNGAWNDDSRNAGTMLYPICQNTIPQSEMSPTGRHMWGNGMSSSFNIRVCIQAVDTLFFQDDRLWFQYGGDWQAAGAGIACPAEYQGVAYVNDQPWDISSLNNRDGCHAGQTCPVSSTYTDLQFDVPMGCASVQVAATVNQDASMHDGGRGTAQVTQPTRANGWRGDIVLSSTDYADTVMDVTVTATCVGTAATHQARLSCVHSAGTDGCKMGRIEVFNNHITRPGSPVAGAWGTVCGHYYWDNDNLANIVCRQMGYRSGQTYTFGKTDFLPTLPVVAGWRACHGGERDVFACEDSSPEGGLDDMDCHNGCVGPDGVQGTGDDTIDGTCPHSIDQGAICYDDSSPPQLARDVCRGCGAGGCALQENTDQEIIFSCIDYYTTQCSYDVTNTWVNTQLSTHDWWYGGNAGSGAGSYSRAMRAFAECAAVSPEPAGYCHGALNDATVLANHDVCVDGATTDIGFHIRVPFKVNVPGDFAFRLHADYGMGSFIGIDGAEYTPGNLWGHMNVDGQSLTAGDHEFDILGFEDCCDGHAELEVHLPCDTSDDAWRIVSHGESPCLSCATEDLPEGCSSSTESAACCGQSGFHIQCGIPAEGSVCGEGVWEDEQGQVDPTTIVGRFVAIPDSMNIDDAIAYCNSHFAGLASIHGPSEQNNARAACRKWIDRDPAPSCEGTRTSDGSECADIEAFATSHAEADCPAADNCVFSAAIPYGCWIGFQDEASEGGFSWVDGTPVDFVAWAPGEPNGGSSAHAGAENAVEMDFRIHITRNGKWNDASSAPEYGMFPLCQTAPAPPPSLGVGMAPPPMVWGTGATASFRLQVCVDHVDTLFFQDDRLWFQYGGQWAAVGAHGSCPDRFRGTAYVNNQEWDISDMAQCTSGSMCPVSKTFTDQQFEVPMGCASMSMDVTLNSGRGTQPQNVVPSMGNNFRGELIISDDGFGGADVYDITVTLTCLGAEGSTPTQPARLSCVHTTGQDTTQACHMGRMEVYNSAASHGSHAVNGQVGSWGTVCGHWTWDNDNAADIVCRQLGFASGEGYTFGATNLLPTLPIVTGFRQCQGTESDLFMCPVSQRLSRGEPADPYCALGCIGADQIYGTLDDTIDPTCTHAIDQGAICRRSDSQQVRSPDIETCRQVAGAGVGATGNLQQPVVFGCIQFVTTNCVYDVTHAGVNADHGMVGSYMDAIRAFAECSATLPEVPGYCSGALQTGSMLSNHMVCMSGLPDDPTTGDINESHGATTDIGFHIRVPFRVNDDGLYTFRYHMDMGLGSFTGVDGPEWRPGNTWGHLETDGTVMAVGEHEFEVLGFEDCCDGHAELEVHIPCDTLASPWRTVAAGITPCMSCDSAIEASCSADTTPAAVCRTETTGCEAWQQPCTPVSEMVCSATGDPTALPTGAHVGRFVAVGRTMNYNDAVGYCEQHYHSLASIHSYDEQQQAASACHAYADATEGMVSNADGSDGNAKYGCWIGFQDLGAEGGFVWIDGSSVTYVDFAPGEPNDVGDGGEDAVEMDFRARLTRFGQWNDATMDQGYEMFPLCETSIPAPVPGEPMNWGTDVQTSFRLRVCIDEADDIHFQDDRLWIQYGGQYSAAGTHSTCPERYRGKAYIGNQQWDISGMSACQAGQNCPVSSTFTDPQFEVPMGCQQITMNVVKTRGRGTVTSVVPAQGNAWRGTITIEDDTPGQHGAEGFGGADVYDVRVTLTCVGGERSAPQTPVRLACTHNHGTDSCHMGRIEVFNPNAMHVNSQMRGTWGTVCGHYFWDNNNLGDIVCRQLGYAGGDTYTFGHSTQLPTLPVVIAGHVCQGTEANIFRCPTRWDSQEDAECLNGCLGADGLQGTIDDTVDPTCPHTVDQGAICHNGDSPSNVALPICQGSQDQSMMTGVGNNRQPVVFSCIDYYTTECTYDVTNSNLANGLGSFAEAMRAFAACADAAVEPPGYCHGSLLDASMLANHDVCVGGSTTNIGFHLRIPFRVNMPGVYSFRLHADYGAGSFVGVDGAEFTPGDNYGLIQTAPQSLAIGEHEFESLGFEDCCDGAAELEVHLPCDAMASPWRLVAHGASDCLQCGAVIAAECSVSDPNAGNVISTGGADGTGR